MDYSLSGPTSASNQQPATFTVTLGAGNPGGTITITPAATPSSGTFSPTTVTLTNSTRTATFTFTAAVTAPTAVSIAVTNSGALVNPAALAVLASPTAANLFTTLKNPGNADRYYSFIGPRGVTIAAGGTYQLQGDGLASPQLRYPRDRDAFANALINGAIEVLATPNVIYVDGISGAVKALDSFYNGTTPVAKDPSFGAYTNS